MGAHSGICQSMSFGVSLSLSITTVLTEERNSSAKGLEIIRREEKNITNIYIERSAGNISMKITVFYYHVCLSRYQGEIFVVGKVALAIK